MKTQIRWVTIFLASLVFVLLQLEGQPAHGATPIESGETHSGVISTPSQMDIWTFYGMADDRIRIDVERTSGYLDTEIILIDPDYLDEVDTKPGGDLLDYILPKTGTYTIVVQDRGLDHTGSYCLTLLNLTAGPLTSAEDPDGGPIASGETRSGSIAVSDMDIYEFYGEAGDRVRIDVERTSGYLDTEMILIDPDVEDEANTQPGGDLLGHVLQKTGTYTILVQDRGLDHTGSYCLTLLNLTAGHLTSAEDPDGGPIASGETRSGSIAVSDMDIYEFYGEAGDRVRIDVERTSGYLDTEIILIDPDVEDEANTQPGGDLLGHVLQKTGTYTILVQDRGLDHTGSYCLTLLKLPGAPSFPGDCDGGLIASGETRSGSIAVSDMDIYEFYGEAGDRVRIDAEPTSGYLDTEMILIDPDYLDEANTQPGGDLLDHILLKTGLYTIVVQDVGLDHTGNYNITLHKFPDPPAPGIYNPDPNIAACSQPADLTLTWDPISDATGYDVFFGTDVVEPLVQVCSDIPNSSCTVSGLEKSTVYYWRVVAHTPDGEIQGTVNWFVTEILGDFDGNCNVDRNDLAVFAADFGRTDCDQGEPCEGDFDEDGDVDGNDLAVFAANFGRTVCP